MSIAKQSREDRAAERRTQEEKLRSENVHPSDDTPMSYFFNLSYANYLVINRSKLESMPQEWQEDMIELLNEMENEFAYLPDQPAINVQILAREPDRFYREQITCEECKGTGIKHDDEGEPVEGEECEFCNGMGDVEDEDERCETPEEVGVITDPIPHYDRTRTRLPLLSSDPKQVLKEAGRYSCFEDWRDHVFGKVYEVDDQVEITHHPDHILPAVLIETRRGIFNGKVVEKLDDDLYKVEVVVTPLAASSSAVTEKIEVQVHVDQMNAA